MLVTVHTRADVAHDLARARPRLAESRKVRKVLAEFGLDLQPLHPATADPELANQFSVTAPDEQVAAELCSRLLATGAVEAAYPKPPDAAP
jgi:hypothetical protein